ncbi:hypothetical protein Deia_00176 [Candidatus Deianiraea vastatrix]|uniref:Uncharacterized protein n=1 Tax=Candidatus Deianiraea vastatrix TaxID=2163644 RepID=A0A5B8XEY9_9RICK|nr:hypothetical protein Deia_00176 [Candidatus Deianiraea vastatrix]
MKNKINSEQKLNEILNDKKLSWNFFAPQISKNICFWYTIFYIYLVFFKNFTLYRLIANSFLTFISQFIAYWVFLFIFSICYGICYTFIYIKIAKLELTMQKIFCHGRSLSNLSTIIRLIFFILINAYRILSVYLIYFLTKFIYMQLFILQE